MDTNDAVTTVNNPEEIDEKNERHLTADDIKKLIQSEVDKVRTKYSQANAELQKKYDSLKQEKLTDDERKQLEIDEREKKIADREKELNDRDHRWYALKAIKNAGLDHGDDTALELVDFVMADSEELIDKKVKTFNSLVKKLVKEEVDVTFKQNGRDISKGAVGASENNPFSKEHFNLSKQMQLYKENPELARQLETSIFGK